MQLTKFSLKTNRRSDNINFDNFIQDTWIKNIRTFGSKTVDPRTQNYRKKALTEIILTKLTTSRREDDANSRFTRSLSNRKTKNEHG